MALSVYTFRRMYTLPFVESVPRLAPSLLRKAIAFSMLLRRAEAERGFLSTNGISEFATKEDYSKVIYNTKEKMKEENYDRPAISTKLISVMPSCMPLRRSVMGFVRGRFLR